jgi:catechol 2,3-dioxygenase-like lactoylglutathione lyase family enzyme
VWDLATIAGKSSPVFAQLNLGVADMAASVAFYRRLGLELDTSHPFAAHHVEAKTPNGLALDLDSVAFAKRWDVGWRGRPGAGGVVIGFNLPSRAAVDERYADLVAAGYVGQQPPHDAFWGARHAIVEDPDGNAVGLMSPVDPARRSAPPSL